MKKSLEKITFIDSDNELSGFKVKKNRKAKKPSLVNLQWLADEKLKRLGAPHPIYDRTSKAASVEATKLLKIYNDAAALTKYFTNK